MHYRINESVFPSLRDPDRPSSELFDMARQVQATIDSPGWAVIMGLVAEAHDGLVFRLTANHEDHSVMARLGGMVEGTRAAQAAADAVLKRDAVLREEIDELTSRELQGG